MCLMMNRSAKSVIRDILFIVISPKSWIVFTEFVPDV